MTTEVREGRLRIDGWTVPLTKGLILLALARAGWTGEEGPLTEDLQKRLFRADPRIAVTVQELVSGLGH